MRNAFQKFLKPKCLSFRDRFKNALQNVELFWSQSAHFRSSKYSVNNLCCQVTTSLEAIAIPNQNDKGFKNFLKRQLGFIETCVQEIYYRLNRILKGYFRLRIDGNDKIQNVIEMSIGSDILIFTEANEGIVNPTGYFR